MSNGVDTSTSNTLRKLGAHLRWHMEKSGVDADAATAVIVVPDETQRSRLIDSMLRDFDQSCMKADDAKPGQVMVHGVRIAVVVKEPA